MRAKTDFQGTLLARSQYIYSMSHLAVLLGMNISLDRDAKPIPTSSVESVLMGSCEGLLDLAADINRVRPTIDTKAPSSSRLLIGVRIQ